MKSAYAIGMIFIVLIALVPKLVKGSEQLKVNSDTLASLKFDAPESLADRKYLKLHDGPNFRLAEVGAKYVIIEIFSMYCPICQRDAPVINQLHDLMLKIPTLKDNVKMVGIGAGNTPYEVSVFRKKFNVSFPLIADDNFAVQKALSQNIRTPTFIVGKLSGAGKVEIIFTRVGAIKDAGEFLKELLAMSK
ncbi:MAG: TlpA family protein disulfide reductase [Deltaproteobacteria bacterium]|nr:TlpA family protein disulfide reductase [Deltaproteobacteria bacterium]